jgi:hypothetical protein
MTIEAGMFRGLNIRRVLCLFPALAGALLVGVLLAAAPLRLAAQSVPAAPAATLSAEQLKRLSAVLESFGEDVPLGKDATHALGLTSGEQTLTLRQLASKDDNGVVHVFFRLADGGLLLMRLTGSDLTSYHLDAAFQTVAAVKANKEAAAKLPLAAAAIEAQTEIAYWAYFIDNAKF